MHTYMHIYHGNRERINEILQLVVETITVMVARKKSRDLRFAVKVRLKHFRPITLLEICTRPFVHCVHRYKCRGIADS